MRKYIFALVAACLFVMPAIAASQVSPARLAHDMRCYGYVSTAYSYFIQTADEAPMHQAEALQFLYTYETQSRAAKQETNFVALMYTQPHLQTVLQFASCRDADIDDAEAMTALIPDYAEKMRPAEDKLKAVIPGAQNAWDQKYKFEHPDPDAIERERMATARDACVTDAIFAHPPGAGFEACVAKATAASNAK